MSEALIIIAEIIGVWFLLGGIAVGVMWTARRIISSRV